MGVLWAALTVGKKVKGKKACDLLLSEVGSWESGDDSSEEEHGSGEEDSMAPKPDNAEGTMRRAEMETVPGASDKGMQRRRPCYRQGRLVLVAHIPSKVTQILDKRPHRHPPRARR